MVTKQDRPQGRGLKPKPNPAKTAAKKLGLEIKEIASKQELASLLQQKKYDLALVAGFSYILPPSVLKSPKTGKPVLGLHPSLLPKYRGPAPIQFAILSGEKETGICLFELTSKMDKGPVLKCKKVKIRNSDTYLSLEEKLSVLGAKLASQIIPLYLQNKIKAKPQRGKPSYSRLLKKEDGKIDWQKMSPEEIFRRFRAFYPWPGVYFEIQGKKVKITELKLNKGRLLIKKVIPEGKKEMGFAEFLRGYPFPLDLRDKIIYP